MRETSQLPGISDMAVYLPRYSIESSEIVTARTKEDAANGERLVRALEYTGQRSIRFTDGYEDSATMAAEAARRLVRQRPEALDGLRIDRLVVLPPSGFGLHPEPTSVAVAG